MHEKSEPEKSTGLTVLPLKEFIRDKFDQKFSVTENSQWDQRLALKLPSYQICPHQTSVLIL